MKTPRNAAYILVIGLFLAACKTTTGGGDPTPANAPKPQLLAGTLAKSWITTSLKINGVESFNQTKPCAQDDILVFKADNSYERGEGPTKCRDKDPQIYEKGTWAFGTADTELIFNKTDRAKLLELTPTTLRFSVVSIFGEIREQTFQAQSN